MGKSAKTEQLQIRVNGQQKQAIARAARTAGMDMSAYVLERVLGQREARSAELLRRLVREDGQSYVLAELNDLLASLGGDELRRAVAAPPPESLPPQAANYAAAMIEQACAHRGVEVPAWTRAVAPLETPFFGSQLPGLRLHLLASSPAPFRRRNIFIDTGVGGRV